MSISAANVAPDFLRRRQISADDLRHLVEPAVIFEHAGIDDDGVRFFVYTVAGWLNGQNIATIQGGATIGGDVIVINAENRDDADAMAGLGLADTINALEREEEQRLAALAAQARLASVGTLDRMDLATRPDKNEQFVSDVDAVRTLVGDDIILTTGR